MLKDVKKNVSGILSDSQVNVMLKCTFHLTHHTKWVLGSCHCTLVVVGICEGGGRAKQLQMSPEHLSSLRGSGIGCHGPHDIMGKGKKSLYKAWCPAQSFQSRHFLRMLALVLLLCSCSWVGPLAVAPVTCSYTCESPVTAALPATDLKCVSFEN